MNIEKFLKDMSFNSRYSFLEEGENKSELASIADKRGIKLPCHDLSIFKCVYGYIERENLNGCTLLKEEVETTLNTLIDKAVDFDHMRKRVVGHWIDAKIVNNEIIAYGVFYKGNFKDDYDVIKDMMEKDVLAISFEAYGNRQFTGDKSYNLRDIEFSGGALLLKTNPAFPGSKVLDFASLPKEKVLEFAKVMTEPKEFVHFKGNKDKGTSKKEEKGYLVVQDLETIYELLGKVECPSCKEKSLGQINMIDFEKHILRVNCYACDAVIKVDLIPIVELIKKGKKPTTAVVKANILENKKGEIDMKRKEDGKYPKFTVKCDECGYTFDSDVRGESTQCTKCGGTTKTQGIQNDGVPAHTKGEEKAMKEKIEALEKELSTLKDSVKTKDEELASVKEELETAKGTVETLKSESEEVKVKIEEIEKAKTAEVAKAKEDATKIAERKADLGEEFSKDVDLLDDTKYELAKAKKELAAKEVEIAKMKKDAPATTKKDLDKGSVNDEPKNEIKQRASRIQKFAFGE